MPVRAGNDGTEPDPHTLSRVWRNNDGKQVTMTDDNDIPSEKLDRWRHSISNLWQEFGSTENLIYGAVINGLIAAFGILLYMAMDGWVAVVGAVLAAIHVFAIIDGVIGR